MQYQQTGERLRSFGLGVLTGNLLGQDDAISKVRENLNFRLQSAREMVSGQAQMSPLQRRKEIRARRLELINIGGDSGSGSQTRSTRGSSGRIGARGGSSGSRENRVSSDVPSMSEVDRGTKKRAQDRGFVD